MSIVGNIMRARRAAERLMKQECEITRVSGQETDPDTGKVSPVTKVIYRGKCKVQSSDGIAQAGDETVAELTATVTRHSVHTPVGAMIPQVGDVVTITASPMDERFIGRKYRVTSNLPAKAFASADRTPVEEV